MPDSKKQRDSLVSRATEGKFDRQQNKDEAKRQGATGSGGKVEPNLAARIAS
jgi:hypothetical protein